MQIFVISLLHSLNRRALISQEFANLGLEFKFFDAVKLDNWDLVPNYDAEFRIKIFGRHLTLGEVGCYMSHQQLWSLAVTLNEDICIIEDDVRLSKNFKEVMTKLTQYHNYDILKLGGVFLRRKFLWDNFQGIRLVKYWFDNMGSQGYLITPWAAKILLEKSAKIRFPLDDLLAQYAFHKLNVVAVDPLPLEHLEELGSELGNKPHKRKMSPLAKVRREISMQYRRCCSLIHQFKFFMGLKHTKLSS